MAEPIFAEGLRVYEPNAGAPSFVKGRISIKVEDFKAFLDKHVNEDGFVNLDMKESRGGKLYAELNTWKKKEVEGQPDPEPTEDEGVDESEEIKPEDLPF